MHCERHKCHEPAEYVKDGRHYCNLHAPSGSRAMVDEFKVERRIGGDLMEARAAAGDPYFDRWEPADREPRYVREDEGGWRL